MKTTKTLTERRAENLTILCDATETETLQEMLAHIESRKGEFSYNVERVGLSRAVTEWLQGLAIGLPFMNGEILEIGQSLYGYDLSSERNADNFIDGWFAYFANEIIRLASKHGVNLR